MPVGFGQRPGQMGISGDSICLLFFLQGPDTDNDMIQFSISQKKRTGQRPTWRTENVFCRKLFWFLFKFEIWTENRQVDWQCSTNGTLQTPNGKDQSFRLLRGKNKYKETYIFKPGTCDHPKLLEYVIPTQYFSSKKLAMGLFSVIIVN